MSKIKNIPGVSPEQCGEAILALRDSLEIWGGKWKLVILLYLVINENNQNLFLQLTRAIPGISPKMLSKELKDMEMNKLVTRITHNTKPVTVEYAVTDYGKAFLPIAESLIKWGTKHRQLIKS